jgi:hypothetical protein
MSQSALDEKLGDEASPSQAVQTEISAVRCRHSSFSDFYQGLAGTTEETAVLLDALS